MLLTHPMPVAVWLDGADRPARLVYQGARYTTVDSPTPLPYALDFPPTITHPPTGPRTIGWRLTARSSATSETLIFDLRQTPNGWLVEQVYA